MKRKSWMILFAVVLSQIFAGSLFAKSVPTITNVSDTVAKIEYRTQDGATKFITLRPGESKTLPEGTIEG